MAWYHVNRCDCPIGDCDCGSPKPKVEAKATQDFSAHERGTCEFCEEVFWLCECMEDDCL